ncbi:MAG TPA: 5'/3'-nucleotidase SurE [Ilumatobacter sp.]|nr:5'/3'-nucleotidase SurE [Ilumatobacter sp.]
MRLLVTNDDGIDAPGLGHLVEALLPLGEVVVIAPDREFSGASQSVGSLMHHTPGVRRRAIDGAEAAWAVAGPPALCVLYADLGLFGPPPDLVVAGINPGANIGRSVYHSGTLGACLSARNCGWSGVAISQSAPIIAADGQAFPDMLGMQKWHVAGEVARTFVGAVLDDLPTEPVVANVNVPNVELADIEGWQLAQVSPAPAATMVDAQLAPIDGDPDAYDVNVRWQRRTEVPPDTDTGTVWSLKVSVSYITRLTHHARPDLAGAEAALGDLLGTPVR